MTFIVKIVQDSSALVFMPITNNIKMKNSVG